MWGFCDGVQPKAGVLGFSETFSTVLDYDEALGLFGDLAKRLSLVYIAFVEGLGCMVRAGWRP